MLEYHKINISMISSADDLFEDNELDDCLLFGVQHCLYTTFKMVEALIKKGLKTENNSLLGKCYSTDPQVYNFMRQKNIDISSDSLRFDSHISYDKFFDNIIDRFLSDRLLRLTSSKYKRIIILDDGGALIQKVQNHVRHFSNVVAIEQTSSGYNELCDENHQIPIINVARAKAKHLFEPDEINIQALGNIGSAIERLGLSEPKRVLVMGNGSVGSSLSKILRKKYHVDVYDINTKKSTLSGKHCLAEILPDYDMILGCSGKVALNYKLHASLKKGCILASLSSSDREFDAVFLRKKLTRITNCFADLKIGNVHLLNCGFPMTFVGKDAEIAEYSHFTRALIMSAIKQALGAQSQNGFVYLDDMLQQRMIKAFINL